MNSIEVAPKLVGLKACWDRNIDQEIPDNHWKEGCASWRRLSCEAQSPFIK